MATATTITPETLAVIAASVTAFLEKVPARAARVLERRTQFIGGHGKAG